MNWLLILVLSAIFFLLILSFLFSGAEIGLTSISRSRVSKLKLKGSKKARTIELLLDKKELTIGTILLCNTIINITCSALFTVIFINSFGNEGILFSTLMMTFCILLFCEVLPKTYAMQNPEKFTLFSAYFMLFFVRLLSPLTLGIQFIVNIILKICWFHRNREVIFAADGMRNMITLHRNEGTMLQKDLDMLNNILDLAETEILQIMTHRKNLFSLDIDRNKEDLIREILSSSHSRVPLWQKEPDNIVGVVYVKNLINALREKDDKVEIDRIMSKPWFILENTPLTVQLRSFRRKREYLAFVVDEYGALQGIVTLEDILKEIVGEISDESDSLTENFIKKISDNIYHIGGKSTIRDINKRLHWDLPNEESTTLAGMIVNEIERIPEENEEFSMYGFYFKILKKDKNIITMIEVQVKTANAVAATN